MATHRGFRLEDLCFLGQASGFYTCEGFEEEAELNFASFESRGFSFFCLLQTGFDQIED